jgi:hypothetical protein
MPRSLSNSSLAMAALAIVSVLGIGFFGQLTREVTRSSLTGGSQPTAALSQEDSQDGAALPVGTSHDVHVFRIGNAQFTVRQPAQLVLLQDSDALERIVHPPDNQLHIAFATAVDVSRIMNDEAPRFDRYVTIQSNRKVDAAPIAPSMFRQIKANIKRQGLGDAIARNTRTINEFLAETGQRIDETRIIGFTETDDSYTLTALVKQRDQYTRVNTVTMRNLRGCCIVVATTAVCRNQEDIDWSQSVAVECVESLK